MLFVSGMMPKLKEKLSVGGGGIRGSEVDMDVGIAGSEVEIDVLIVGEGLDWKVVSLSQGCI